MVGLEEGNVEHIVDAAKICRQLHTVGHLANTVQDRKGANKQRCQLPGQTNRQLQIRS